MQRGREATKGIRQWEPGGLGGGPPGDRERPTGSLVRPPAPGTPQPAGHQFPAGRNQWVKDLPWRSENVKPILAKARKTNAGRRWSRSGSTRDLPTIAFFRAGPLLRRNGPVSGILAAHRPGAIMDKSGRRFVVRFGWGQRPKSNPSEKQKPQHFQPAVN